MKKFKGIVALLVCFLMVAALITGCAGSEDKNGATQQTTQAPGTNQTEGSASQGDGSYFPLKTTAEISVFGCGWVNPIETLIGMQDTLKKLNIKVKWDGTWDGLAEKKDIALATKNITDLMWVSSADTQKYGPMGAFVELSQYIDKMPNVKKWLEKYDAYKYSFMMADGKFYGVPKSTEQDQNTILWAYNKEKFDEWGIAEPKTLDEMYQAAKTIKAKNPTKYFPIVGTVPNPQIEFYSVLKAVCNSMGIGDDADINYYIKEDTYKYTVLNPKFKEAVEYVKKLYDEQLISPNYLTIAPGADREYWDEWSGGGDVYDHFTGFIGSMALGSTKEFQRWADNEKITGNKQRPSAFGYTALSNEVSMTAVNPVTNGTENGGSVYVCNAVCIGAQAAKDPAKLEMLLKIIDWMYSDEAILMYNYGREGTHYDMVDGKPVLKPLYVGNTKEYHDVNDKGTPVRDRYDAAGWDPTKISMEDQILSWGFYTVYPMMPFNQIELMDPMMQMWPSSNSKEITAYNAELKKNATIIGKRPLPFDADQTKKKNDLTIAARDYSLQEVDKFIMGKRSMTEWDAFINELKAKGASELENLYNSVYAYQVKK